MSVIISKLGLKDITDAKLPEYAKDKVVKVLANSAFASVAPSPAELAGKTNEYENALVKSDDEIGRASCRERV